MKKTGLWTVTTVVFLFILSIMGAIIRNRAVDDIEGNAEHLHYRQ